MITGGFRPPAESRSSLLPSRDSYCFTCSIPAALFESSDLKSKHSDEQDKQHALDCWSASYTQHSETSGALQWSIVSSVFVSHQWLNVLHSNENMWILLQGRLRLSFFRNENFKQIRHQERKAKQYSSPLASRTAGVFLGTLFRLLTTQHFRSASCTH